MNVRLEDLYVLAVAAAYIGLCALITIATPVLGKRGNLLLSALLVLPFFAGAPYGGMWLLWMFAVAPTSVAFGLARRQWGVGVVHMGKRRDEPPRAVFSLRTAFVALSAVAVLMAISAATRPLGPKALDRDAPERPAEWVFASIGMLFLILMLVAYGATMFGLAWSLLSPRRSWLGAFAASTTQLLFSQWVIYAGNQSTAEVYVAVGTLVAVHAAVVLGGLAGARAAGYRLIVTESQLAK